jgi:hypothetical protein
MNTLINLYLTDHLCGFSSTYWSTLQCGPQYQGEKGHIVERHYLTNFQFSLLAISGALVASPSHISVEKYSLIVSQLDRWCSNTYTYGAALSGVVEHP